jgi:threonine dehydratase
MNDRPLVTIDDILEAARRIAPAAIRTPLIENPVLNDRCGRRVLVKFEGAQRTGSFKFRGAYNRLSRIAPEARAAGVVAWSSGNHAQGIAAAAALLEMPATIVMPSDAPAIKMANTRALGAGVVLYDRYTESREEIATMIAATRGAVLVPSFDDPDVIAGQGTAGLEIVEQVAAIGVTPDLLLCPCGGGGLIAGVATAVKATLPDIALYAVEPTGFDDTARSLASGRRESADPAARSICDALLAPMPGALTFPINRALLAGGIAVTDDQVRAAVRFAFETLKLVAEPGGAVALAAALHGLSPQGDGPMVAVISGANVDADVFAGIIFEGKINTP